MFTSKKEKLFKAAEKGDVAAIDIDSRSKLPSLKPSRSNTLRVPEL